MEKPVATAYTEAAWDALQDGMEFVLRLFSGPKTTAELAAVTHEDPSLVARKLARMTKVGLLRQLDDRWEPVAHFVHQVRQEGMVTSLTRYVLPSLTRAARESEAGYWAQLDLDLAPEEQVGLRAGLVKDLNDELYRLSLDPSGEEQVVGTSVIVGTSDVPGSIDPTERLFETVRRAARQRATPDSSGRAVLNQLDGLFGIEAISAAEEAVRAAVERLRPRESRAGERAKYTMLLGFFARGSLRVRGGDDEA